VPVDIQRHDILLLLEIHWSLHLNNYILDISLMKAFIIFNLFRSVTYYKTEGKPIFSHNTTVSSDTMNINDNINDDVWQNCQE
jgi:hypothetical protein